MHKIIVLLHLVGVSLFLVTATAQGKLVDLCAASPKHLAELNRKMVSIRAVPYHSMEYSGLYSVPCNIPIAISYPGDKGIKVDFHLKEDEEWKKYNEYDSLNKPLVTNGDPRRYKITATFYGLFLRLPPTRKGPRPILRIVVQSISNVNVEEQ